MTIEESAAHIQSLSDAHKLAEYRSRGCYLHSLTDAALVTRWVSTTRALGAVLAKMNAALDAGTPSPDLEYVETLEKVFDAEAEMLEREIALPLDKVMDVIDLAVEVWRKTADHDAMAEMTAASLDAAPVRLVLQ